MKNTKFTNITRIAIKIVVILKVDIKYIVEKFLEVKIMQNNQSNSNRMEVPQAKEAMDRFKMEVASELGVPLKQGYNGDLTSRQNGSVGGEMVRRMIKRQEEEMSSK